MTPTDTLAVFLIGHGTHDGEQYKYNLPGPDIDGETLASLMSAIPASDNWGLMRPVPVGLFLNLG
ncbi:MAG: hypothetical protein CM1200mP36_11690 [Gammaproteobacteria bacterium]|nr:MAG: hypothetical protein CM1200mP36_11690 [Gammaproteobacteria bacterium]